MITYSISGRGFASSLLRGDATLTYWGPQTYLARTVIGVSSQVSSQAYGYLCEPTTNTLPGSVTASTASSPISIRTRLSVAWSVLGIPDGSTDIFYTLKLSGLAGYGATSLNFQVSRSGSTYTITLGTTWGTVTLISGITTGTWYRVGCDFYADIIRPWATGAYLSNITGVSSTADRLDRFYLNAFNLNRCYMDDLMISQGFDGSGTSLVTVNDTPADGEILWVKKSYLQAGVAGGDVVRTTVADGVQGAGPSVNTDWLRATCLENGEFGEAKRQTRTAGVLADNYWSM